MSSRESFGDDLHVMSGDLRDLKDGFFEHTKEDRDDFIRMDVQTKEMRSQISSMHEELSQVKDDVSELKVDVKGIKTDLVEVKTSQAWIIKLGGAILGGLLIATIGFVFLAIRKGAGL